MQLAAELALVIPVPVLQDNVNLCMWYLCLCVIVSYFLVNFTKKYIGYMYLIPLFYSPVCCSRGCQTDIMWLLVVLSLLTEVSRDSVCRL